MRLAPASQPAQKRKEPINLLKGSPNPSLHPTRLLLQAAQTVLSDPSLSTPALGYGPEQGHPPLLANLATWLTNFYQPCTGAVTAERLAITGGASQNLGNMLAVFTDPEATLAVWLVAPAYFLAFGIFEDAGLAMRAVPEDEQGLDLEYLDREIGRCETEAAASEKKDPTREATKTGTRLKREGKLYRHVIYCVPSFSNPSGRTMSPDRRRELVRLARRYDALVICDDVYDFLQWPARGEDTLEEGYDTLRPATAALPRLVDIDRELDGGTDREGADGFGNAISNGSFSKIAGPGLRCGWVEGTEKFAYGVSQTYVSFFAFLARFPSILSSIALRSLSRSSIPNHSTSSHPEFWNQESNTSPPKKRHHNLRRRPKPSNKHISLPPPRTHQQFPRKPHPTHSPPRLPPSLRLAAFRNRGPSFAARIYIASTRS